MATKEEIRGFLDECPGIKKSDMKEYWKRCARNGAKLPYPVMIDSDVTGNGIGVLQSDDCAELRAAGVKWKHLPVEILYGLEDLAIVTAEEWHEAQLCNEDEEIFRKLRENRPLDGAEIRTLVEKFADETKRVYGENGRWTRSVTDIVEEGGRFYRIDWQNGLAELQENEYDNQPVRVYPVKTMTVSVRTEYTTDATKMREFVSEENLQECLAQIAALNVCRTTPCDHEEDRPQNEMDDGCGKEEYDYD